MVHLRDIRLSSEWRELFAAEQSEQEAEAARDDPGRRSWHSGTPPGIPHGADLNVFHTPPGDRVVPPSQDVSSVMCIASQGNHSRECVTQQVSLFESFGATVLVSPDDVRLSGSDDDDDDEVLSISSTTTVTSHHLEASEFLLAVVEVD